jgi:hypothetical protein
VINSLEDQLFFSLQHLWLLLLPLLLLLLLLLPRWAGHGATSQPMKAGLLV